MIFTTITAGPFAIPSVVPSVFIAFVCTRLLLPAILKIVGVHEPRSESTALLDTVISSLIVGFFVWKLIPLFTITAEIRESPRILLRAPGGNLGVVTGIFFGLGYALYQIWFKKRLARPFLSAAIGLVLIGIGTVSTGYLIRTLIPESAGTVEIPSTIRFRMVDGTEKGPEDLLGTPTVLTFWATWCGPCEAEIPFKKKLYEQFGSDNDFIAVNLTRTEAGIGAVTDYIAIHDIQYPVALDGNNQLATAFLIRGTPTTIILDAEGTLVARWTGPSSYDRIARYLHK